MNQDAVKKLEEAVVAVTCGCALERLHAFVNANCQLLTDVALEIGFTYKEAWGIMDGWDLEAHNCCWSGFHDSDEYRAGRTLGKRLFTLASPR